MKTIEKRDYLREESTVPDKQAVIFLYLCIAVIANILPYLASIKNMPIHRLK